MAHGRGQSKTTQKPAHCECPGLTGNAWKCGKNLKWIKKSHLSGDFLLLDIIIDELGKIQFAVILFILLWLLLLIFYTNEIFSKCIQKTPKMLFINEVYFEIPKAPKFFQRFSNTLNFIEGHFSFILFIVFTLSFVLALIVKFVLALISKIFFLKIFFKNKKKLRVLRVVFYFPVYYFIFYIIVLALKDNTYILLSNDKLPTILIGFTTILFTMLIPIGIAILNKLYRKEEKAEKFGSLNLRIFLAYGLNPAYFIFWLLVAFVPLLIFQTNGINIDAITKINVGVLMHQSFVVSVSFIGVLFLALRLIKIYNWSENEKIEYRKMYLNDAGFNKEFIDAWKSVWIAKDIDEKEEKEYLCIFVRRVIESLSCKEKLDITKKLLEDFKENLSNRNFENMRFIHDILIEIAEEIKISKFKDKIVYTIPSIKNTPNIINEILNHINNYEWKNSNKTCYNAVCYIYLYNLFNYPVYYSFHRK